MTDYQRIPVSPGAYEAAKAAKKDGESWSEFVLRCADADVPQKWTESELREMAREEARGALQEVAR